MAMPRRISITQDEVFPFGAFLVSEVTPVWDFERSTRELKVQQVDKETELLLWSVEVLDADPEAPKREKTVSVKFAAKVQPVPPHNGSGMPFNPVELEGLTALPYVVSEEGRRPRMAWSFRATGMKAPGKVAPAPKPASEGRAA